MTPGSGSIGQQLKASSTTLENVLRWFAAYWLPASLLLLTAVALFKWNNLYSTAGGEVVHFQVVATNTEQLTPADARSQFAHRPAVDRWDSKLSEAPVWILVPLSSTVGNEDRVLDFPSRHAVEMRCWNALDLTPLGGANRKQQDEAFRLSRGGFALQLPGAPMTLLCQAAFQGPARFTVRQWSTEAYAQKVSEFHRNSGLLDGGLLVLAAFILIAGLINRNNQYLLFACWLVINLRMAALSAGWDYHWLGYMVPAEWLSNMRALTLGLFYVVTIVLYRTLFDTALTQIGKTQWVQRVQWTCIPVLVMALVLPYGQFLPFIWVMSGLATALLVSLLVRILVETRSRVALWYAASISVALFASFYEVIAAAMGLKGLLGAVNSVTAALTSSLLAAVAVAEQMRQEHQERLAVQRELQHAYEVIPIGLFTLDKQGFFLSANPALLDMLGNSVLQPGHDHWNHYFNENEWQMLANQAMQGHPVELELTLGHLTGQEDKRFLLKAAPASDKIEGSLQDITEKARANRHLEFLANHDPLTKVLNRRGIESALQSGLQQLGKGQPLAVAYLDLDRFKLINDLYGHTAGDEVLQQVCARIQAPLGPYMHLGRVGGDEFLIVMIATPLPQAEAVCSEIVASLANQPYQVGERAFQVHASVGLLEVSPGATAKDIVSTADRACREAKSGQPAGLKVYDKASRVFSEHEAEMHLVERLANHQHIDGLFIEMQPIMSLRAPYASLNFEVLLRMQDENGDRVPTPRLIQAGENAGRMGVIDRWVLSTTLDWLKRNESKLAHNQFVCMNLSGASLNDERFMHEVFETLAQAGTVAQRLCLEVTESVALNDTGNTRRFIDKVRSFGAKVALDDFGAGYTSFSYLKDLPADLLKIDGSFIVNMNQHPANIAIVEAIVSLAQNLGMKTIAEWAEDFETVETLAEIGVDYVQGFIVARPQNPDRLACAASGADFIQDASLLNYLSTLSGADDEGGHVDLVLGSPDQEPPQA
jgi:diguanylate cyclase (GGDEF)-like protein